MEKWMCEICGYTYDLEKGAEGIEKGTSFDRLPDDWVCPICGAGKDKFESDMWK